MLKLIVLMTSQSLFLVGSQVFLKMGLKTIDFSKFSIEVIFKMLLIY